LAFHTSTTSTGKFYFFLSLYRPHGGLEDRQECRGDTTRRDSLEKIWESKGLELEKMQVVHASDEDFENGIGLSEATHAKTVQITQSRMKTSTQHATRGAEGYQSIPLMQLPALLRIKKGIGLILCSFNPVATADTEAQFIA
ncbi:hypothetical protein THAOC_14332, partial [Thalassiosira oceanica]